jgi:hypothetical protein
MEKFVNDDHAQLTWMAQKGVFQYDPPLAEESCRIYGCSFPRMAGEKLASKSCQIRAKADPDG